MNATITTQKNSGIVSNGIMGMIFVLATEGMFFAGLISAYVVNKAGAVMWPPYGQPRLPVEVTAVNTIVLLSSAIAITLFARKFKTQQTLTPALRRMLTLSILLGITFVAVQGSEWVKLIAFGLTTKSSLYGSFFYLLIGMHALHVVGGLGLLLYLSQSIKKMKSAEAISNRITVCSLYWYFVVGIWPILYILVYLM
jgi:heme/copper-type cytochrome/quinol oxidase subunit 3